MSALACGHELIIGMLLVNIPTSINETLLVIFISLIFFLHIFKVVKVPVSYKTINM